LEGHNDGVGDGNGMRCFKLVGSASRQATGPKEVAIEREYAQVRWIPIQEQNAIGCEESSLTNSTIADIVSNALLKAP
jgi:hypothetical protein